MAEVSQIILSDLSGQNIDTSHLGVEIRRARGFFNRRQLLDVFGTVRSETDRQAVLRVATRHAGDDYDVEDNVVVHTRSN